MKIVIFGATGGTGRQLVEQALEQSHNVTAFVRDPEKLNISLPNLRVITGDVRIKEDVDKAIAGQEAVFSTLGVGPRQKPICAEGVRNMTEVMKKHGVRRIVVESNYGSGHPRGGLYVAMLRLMIKSLIKDKEEMEEILKRSDLEWVVVRPTVLTNGPKTDKYHHGVNIKVKLFYPHISRADVADFMLKQLKDNTYLGQAAIITY